MEFVRIFTEVGEEADIAGQFFAKGLEKKEVAQKKCRSLPTVVAQITELYSKLGIRNRSELSIEFAKRLNEMKISLDYMPQIRSFIACGMLCVFTISMFSNDDFSTRHRRVRFRKKEVIEIVYLN